MNQQNNPARIRAKRNLAQLLKDIAYHADVVLGRNAYSNIDEIVDDIITAAADQVKAETGNPSLDQALNEGDGVYRP